MTKQLLLWVTAMCFGCSKAEVAQVKPHQGASTEAEAAPLKASAGASQPPSVPPTRPVPAASATATIVAEPANTTRITQLNNLRFTFTLTHARSSAEASVEFITPAGTPYERRSQPLAVSVQPVQKVSFLLPISGTVISRARLAGSWKANLYLGDELIFTQPFELTP